MHHCAFQLFRQATAPLWHCQTCAQGLPSFQVGHVCRSCTRKIFPILQSWDDAGVYAKIRRQQGSCNFRFVPISPHIRVYHTNEEQYLGVITGLCNRNQRADWFQKAQRLHLSPEYQNCAAYFVAPKIRVQGKIEEIEQFASDCGLLLQTPDIKWSSKDILARMERQHQIDPVPFAPLIGFDDTSGRFNTPVVSGEAWSFVKEEFLYPKYRFVHNERFFLTHSEKLAVWMWSYVQQNQTIPRDFPTAIARYCSSVSEHTSGFFWDPRNKKQQSYHIFINPSDPLIKQLQY